MLQKHGVRLCTRSAVGIVTRPCDRGACPSLLSSVASAGHAGHDGQGGTMIATTVSTATQAVSFLAFVLFVLLAADLRRFPLALRLVGRCPTR